MEHDNSGLTLVFINDETGEPWEGLEEVVLDPKTSAALIDIAERSGETLEETIMNTLVEASLKVINQNN